MDQDVLWFACLIGFILCGGDLFKLREMCFVALLPYAYGACQICFAIAVAVGESGKPFGDSADVFFQLVGDPDGRGVRTQLDSIGEQVVR